MIGVGRKWREEQPRLRSRGGGRGRRETAGVGGHGRRRESDGGARWRPRGNGPGEKQTLISSLRHSSLSQCSDSPQSNTNREPCLPSDQTTRTMSRSTILPPTSCSPSGRGQNCYCCYYFQRRSGRDRWSCLTMLWLETGQRAGQRRLKGWTSNRRLERVQKDDHCSRESQQVCSTRSKMSSTWRRADETPSSVPLEIFMSS